MAARKVPPPLRIGSETSPEWLQMQDRITRWRSVYPALWAKFWTPEGDVRCIFCGRTGAPTRRGGDGKTYLTFTVITWPGSAPYNALQLGGIDSLYYADVSDQEYWAGWCHRCPPPTGAAEWALVAEATWRRAGVLPDAPGQ